MPTVILFPGRAAMKTKSVSIIIGLFLISTGFFGASYPVKGNEINASSYVSFYTSHAPIFIEGNDDFTQANGVTNGTGTSNDPYIIEGWEINASAKNGIEIWNTTDHFIIRDILVNSINITHHNIFLYNLTNGIVENCTLVNNFYGISLENSYNNKIIGNNVTNNNNIGIYLTKKSNNNIITGNQIKFNNYGITIKHSIKNNIIGNNITGSKKGIEFVSSTLNNVSANYIYNNTEGV
jgi:parallel beta-helix repeat protein